MITSSKRIGKKLSVDQLTWLEDYLENSNLRSRYPGILWKLMADKAFEKFGVSIDNVTLKNQFNSFVVSN